MRTRRLARCTLVCAALLLAPAGAVDGASPSTIPSPLPSPAPACANLFPGEYTITIDVAGLSREVLVHVPPAVATPGARLPLVIGFHGYTSYAWQLSETARLSAAADEDGFVLAYPQGLRVGSWPTDWFIPGGPDRPPASVDDIAMVEALLDLAGAEGCIDVGRIVVMGHSKGGGMAEAAACHLADRLAGAVLISPVQFGIPCEPARPIPIAAVHAVDDEVLPYEGGQVAGAPSWYARQLPIEQGMAEWAVRDGCTGGPAMTEQQDGGAILVWEACAAPVVLHRLASGGHDYSLLGSELVREMVRAS
jgi:polyhydroxybutyrate depolymerase